MLDSQLSFLTCNPASFDLNSVDDGFLLESSHRAGHVKTTLARSPVDDCVFGLGFTNWKCLIDHALLTGHFELHQTDERFIGLRKFGIRYSPIPRIPNAGVVYIQRRLLAIAAERRISLGRHERMIHLTSGDFQYKCVLQDGNCDITIKQCGVVIRGSILIEDLEFCGSALNICVDLARQLEQMLVYAGAHPDKLLNAGAKSLAEYILRVVQGVR
jgi:hypothetical protein